MDETGPLVYVMNIINYNFWLPVSTHIGKIYLAIAVELNEVWHQSTCRLGRIDTSLHVLIMNGIDSF